MSDNNNNESTVSISAHVSPELDYSYRDIANVYIGNSDVLIEFGNFHRNKPGHAAIYNRIVLSMSNAYALQQSLAEALAENQRRIQEQLDK